MPFSLSSRSSTIVTAPSSTSSAARVSASSFCSRSFCSLASSCIG
nr:MAG TPA: hypothetical protein [Caudoviricetes sp.]